MIRCFRSKLVLAVSILFASFLTAEAEAQLSKVDRLLAQNGLQVQASTNPDGTFYFNGHLVGGQQVNGFTQANYSAVEWQSGSRFTDSDGVPITSKWAKWVLGNDPMPDQVPSEQPHLSDLVTLQIGDEEYWESNPSVQTSLVTRFQNANADANFNNTILYTNNFIGQTELNAAGMSNFIQQAHPDMLTFDWYPYTQNNASAPDDSLVLNTPFDSWYTEMRFFRDVTLDNSYQPSNPNYSVAWGAYRQTYATTGDGTRPPSATEYAVQTNTALALNAKTVIDFLYNGSASTLFTDTNQLGTTPFYNTVQKVNKHTQNLGRALVRLTPMIANPDPNWATGTPDVLFLRGQQVTGNPASPTTPNALPNGWQPNSVNGSLESSWTANANDPWISGFGQANIGGTVNKYTNAAGSTLFGTGDALISWFRPIGESQSQATSKADIYIMIVNALASPTATPEQCLQNIHIDFSAWPLAPGQTIPSIQYVDPDTGQVVTLMEDQTGLKITNATIEPPGTFLLTNTSGDPTNKTGKLRLNVYLDGGDAFLFKFNNGTPFQVPEPSGLFIAGVGFLALRRKR